MERISDKYIYYKKGYKYQLEKTCILWTNIYPEKDIMIDYISLSKEGKLTLQKGYAWDGASGGCPDVPSIMRGSLGHDAIYQLIRLELLDPEWRHEGDLLLKTLCDEDGMWKVMREIVYNAVRRFASFAADPKNKRRVIKAP